MVVGNEAGMWGGKFPAISRELFRTTHRISTKGGYLMASKGFRQFSIMQYEKNPKTGESLNFNESNIISAISHKTIKDYAYILHDKDTKTELTDGHPDVAIGALIPRHWHSVIRCKNAVEIHTIAEWFDVPDNFVQVIKGANAFWDCVEYLTHEHPDQQAKGKYKYPDEEIKSNLSNWREQLELYKLRRVKKNGSRLNSKDYYRNEVLYHGMTLRQVIDEDADVYRNDWQTLDKLRLKHIKQFAELPTTRVNYYINGRGGVGKGLLCEALARSLFPELQKDDDIFFTVGGNNVAFEGYDGQPVIIWDDARAFSLLQQLGGRENVFRVFDTHPKNIRQHVKHDSIRLTNQVNIVNGIEDFTTFLDGLAGEYKDKDGILRKSEDKGQSYRRFPIIIPIHECDFDVLLNKGVLEGTREYQQFVAHYHIRGNMQRIHQQLSGYEDKVKEIESKVVAPIIEAHNSIYSELAGGNSNANLCDILEEFKDYGKQDLEACRRDEIKKFEDFIQLQNKLIDEEINYCTDPNSPNYQKALIAQKLIKENPEAFYKRTDLHLQVTPFSGAYRY